MRQTVLAVFAVGFGLVLGCSKARNDQTIATDIKAALFSDSQTKGANIDITVKDGTVTLTGNVPDENTRYEAFKVAKETSGVLNVEDRMSLPSAPATVATQEATAAPSKKAAADPKPARAHRLDSDSLPVRPLTGFRNASSNDSPYASAPRTQQDQAPCRLLSTILRPLLQPLMLRRQLLQIRSPPRHPRLSFGKSAFP